MTREPRRIDWDDVRARLAATRPAVAAAEFSMERVGAIFRERAEALARPRTEVARRGGLRVLEVAVGGERFGLALSDVAGVLPFDGGTPVPGGPPELLGVISVRGDLRSVTDLGRLLGVPARTVRGTSSWYAATSGPPSGSIASRPSGRSIWRRASTPVSPPRSCSG